MKNIKQLQSDFQSYIFENNLNIVESISPSKKLSASQRMQIYQNNYYACVISAMKQDFPVLCAHLGEAAFNSMVCDYVRAYPSQHFNLSYIGKNLADFILEKDQSFKVYADLARSEYSLITGTDH